MKSIFEALAKAQAEFPVIPKNKKVKARSFDYWYADWDTVVQYTKPILTKHGLSFSQEIHENNCVTHIMHVSGESIVRCCPIIIPKTSMQEVGAALTYAKRYGFSLAFGIATDDDLDANELINDQSRSISTSNKKPPAPSTTAAEINLPPSKYTPATSKALSPAQIKRAYAIGHAHKWSPAMCDALSNKLFKSNISQLSSKRYNDLCTVLENECTQHWKDELAGFVKAPNFAAKVQAEVKRNYVDHTAAPPTSLDEELPY